MAKHLTEAEIEELQKNPYVKNVSISTITYTQEFREFFMNQYKSGKIPSQIVYDAGFEPKVLGNEWIHNLTKRFKKMTLRSEGFEDTRKGNSGRPSTKELTVEEELERLKHKVKYLEQENESLKKIEFLDRQTEWHAKWKQCHKKNSNSSRK